MPESLPSPRPWTPSHRDVEPEVKAAAVALVERAATWDAGEGSPRDIFGRLRQAGYEESVALALGPVADDALAAGVKVVVAQYGGLLETSASVLVAFEQWLAAAPGRVRRRGTTLDVRLELRGREWQVVVVRPARRGARDTTTDAARRVLDSQRIRLPDAAAADVRSGQVDDDVLMGLLQLARSYRLDVSVLRSGHPIRVFGTDRISDHTVGRAADVWAIDGRPVIERGPDGVVSGFMRAALAVGAYQVGGPLDLDGAGASTFSDDTHQDHVHLGF